MTVRTEDVTFASNGGTANGYLATPDDGQQHPGVIVIQEWWGLNDNIKDIARRFADAGFVALAPDLYHGKVVLMGEPNEAQKAAMSLDQAEVMKDLKGAIAFLQAQGAVLPKRVGVTGFCMGGTLALEVTSAQGANVGAAVSFYSGGYQPTADKVAAMQCPVLAIYASEDGSTPESMRNEFRKQLTDQGKTFDMVVYQNAQHAFFNDERPEVYDDVASKDAWQRTINWFTTYLV